MSPYEAERMRRRIEAVWLGGLGISEALVLLVIATGGQPTLALALAGAFAWAFIVFEVTIHVLAHWWFG